VNRGKRSIALDLSCGEGRTVLEVPLNDADVLVVNFLPGTMERWELGYEAVLSARLPLKQDETRLKGHAVEVRVYAENPAKNFMPSAGRIRAWRIPEETGGLRIDAGYRSGSNVSPHYDAMLRR